MLTPPETASPIVSFVHGGDRKELEALLQRDDVFVTFREEGTQVHAAVALCNNRDDVERLLGVLAKVA